MLKSAPFKLVSYIYDQIELRQNDKFVPRDLFKNQYGGNVSIARSIDPLNEEAAKILEVNDLSPVVVTLKVQIKEQDDFEPSILGTLATRGIFAFDSRLELSQEEQIKIAGTTGASILYGCVREMVQSLSPRISVVGTAYLLPTICFDPDLVLEDPDSRVMPAKPAAAKSPVKAKKKPRPRTTK